VGDRAARAGDGGREPGRHLVAAGDGGRGGRAYAEITSKEGRFRDRDLYLVVYGLDGKVWAHGQNTRMVGKVVIDLRDIDGKEFVRERVELAKAKPTFWQDYKFTNPVSKKIEPKQMYCERLDDTVVCGGIYKH